MTNEELTNALAEANAEIKQLQSSIHLLEYRASSLPETMILSDNFLKRALAIYGHVLVASLLIAIPLLFLLYVFNG